MDQADICNLALIKIGNADNYITTIDDDLKEARVLKSVYDHCVDLVFGDYPWNCATKTVKLTAAVSLPAAVIGWSYAFSYPGDCVTLLGVWDDATCVDLLGAGSIEHKRYEQYILTDDAYLNGTAHEVWVKYTSNTTEVANYDARVIEALSLVLAFYIHDSLKGPDPRTKGALWSEYQTIIEDLRTTDMLEGSDQSGITSSFVDVRD
jgi:hypothetical protein